MVQTIWKELPKRFPGLQLDSFVIMPNHIHGIIVLTDTDRGEPRVRPDNTIPSGRGEPGVRPDNTPDATDWADTRSAPTRMVEQPSLARVVQAFKSLTTVAYVAGVKTRGWITFPGRLWQRNYYEHVIRSEDELNRAREYVENNPLKYLSKQEDPLHWR